MAFPIPKAMWQAASDNVTKILEVFQVQVFNSKSGFPHAEVFSEEVRMAERAKALRSEVFSGSLGGASRG